MNARLLSRLEHYIDKFMTENCEAGDWADAYIHPHLKAQMAVAASLVYDSSIDGQKYADLETGFGGRVT